MNQKERTSSVNVKKSREGKGVQLLILLTVVPLRLAQVVTRDERG